MAATLATPIPPTTPGAGVRGPPAVGAGKAWFCSRGMGETLFRMKIFLVTSIYTYSLEPYTNDVCIGRGKGWYPMVRIIFSDLIATRGRSSKIPKFSRRHMHIVPHKTKPY